MSTKTKLGKMCDRNATFVVLSLFLLIMFCDTTSSECTQLAPCICSLPDGHYYNLTGLADAEPFMDAKFNWTVYFHPCTNRPIVIGNDNKTCTAGNGVSLCMSNNNKKVLVGGKIENTHMKLSTEGNFPIFEIYNNGIRSTINIVCFSDNKTNFALDPPSSDSKNFYFKLVTPYGCKIQPEKGLSTGSVLVILFFVCFGVYFIGGIIALKTLRGATGWEMVPNHDIWFMLPSLVRDGVVFTFNCCRADSYERI
ncbi:cation-dependent mannose-6-phosphate receptor [Solenopsis invicta]|uniref:cation-dependent mannose-6-phosphate receptor n=1 Tax=Solenopsis invicta TaxID=13686 RepID=UPI00193CF1E9|nr:cation-dependent mannose-6-phosphate receptor [Solenopsis invicta]XP_039302747.1 cation-dependent mannose-6-phosphate receptor [Solenopsis invicta]